MLPIYLVFSAYGMVGKGTAAACAVATILIAVRLNWEYAARIWFWFLIAGMVVLNALLVISIPFPNKNYTFPIVAPIGYFEYLLISTFIKFAAKKLKSMEYA